MTEKEKVLKEILVGIYKYTKIINEHKGAVLERENLEVLVKAYEVVNEEDDTDDFKRTLKETFNL